MSDLFALQNDSASFNKEFSETEKISWLRLIRTEGIGPITFYQLTERFGSAQKAIEHLPELSKRAGRMKVRKVASLESAEKELSQLERFGAQIICAGEQNYPLALSAIDDAPPVITIRGDAGLLQQQGIGVVGARNAS